VGVNLSEFGDFEARVIHLAFAVVAGAVFAEKEAIVGGTSKWGVRTVPLGFPAHFLGSETENFGHVSDAVQSVLMSVSAGLGRCD
jgi:hypothetical protein